MTAIALPVTITPPFEPRANGVTARSISPAPRTSTGLEAKAYARMQRSRSQHFGSIVYEWRLGKGAYRIVGNGPVHRSTHFIGPERNAHGMDGNSIWRQRTEFRFGNYIGVRCENADICPQPSGYHIAASFQSRKLP
jgi:hypothetical protein